MLKRILLIGLIAVTLLTNVAQAGDTASSKIITTNSNLPAQILVKMDDGSEKTVIIYSSSIVDDKTQIEQTLDSIYKNIKTVEILTVDGKQISSTEYSKYAGIIKHEVKDASGKRLNDSSPSDNLKGIDTKTGDTVVETTPNNNIVDNSSVKVTYNGKQVVFDNTPLYNKNYRTMVPYRAVFEAFGADVYYKSYGSDMQVVSAILNGVKIDAKVGDNRIFRNGKEMFIDPAPENKGGRIYMPIRFCAEILGMDVNWDPVANSIKISNKIGGIVQ